MKKIVLFLFFAAILQSVLSQEKENSPLSKVNAMFAPGYSTVNGGPSWCGAFGFQLGLETLLYPICNNSFVKVGILFSSQGAAYEENYDSGLDEFGYSSYDSYNTKGKVKLSYIGVPIFYSHQFGNGIYAEAGLEPGILVGAKDKIDDGESYDYSDYIKTFHLGLPIGAGYHINEKLSVGAKVLIGLTNINNSDAIEQYGEDASDRNLLFMGVVRYQIYSKQ